METKIGIKKADLAKVAESLNKLLADETVLYIKTRNAHWNVEGADFHAMHVFFEEQYTQLESLIDDVAERIRTLGHYPVATMKEYLEITHLSEMKRGKNDSQGFIKALLSDHETIAIHLRGNIDKEDGDWYDAATGDFVTGLLETHEKMAWMLRSHLV